MLTIEREESQLDTASMLHPMKSSIGAAREGISREPPKAHPATRLYIHRVYGSNASCISLHVMRVVCPTTVEMYVNSSIPMKAPRPDRSRIW